MALHAGERQRREAAEPLAQGLRRRLERLAVVEQVIQEAAGEHRVGVQGLASQQHTLGHRQPQPVHVPLHAAAIEVQSQSRGGHEHLALRHAEPEIAGQREVGGAAVDTALEGCDRHRPGLFPGVGERLEQGARVHAGHCVDVEAAAEMPTLGLQQQHAHRRRGFDFPKVGLQRLQVDQLEAVGDMRPPQRHAGERAIDLQRGDVLRHGGAV